MERKVHKKTNRIHIKDHRQEDSRNIKTRFDLAIRMNLDPYLDSNNYFIFLVSPCLALSTNWRNQEVRELEIKLSNPIIDPNSFGEDQSESFHYFPNNVISLWDYLYLRKCLFVCLFVWADFSQKFRNWLGYRLAQSCFLVPWRF